MALYQSEVFVGIHRKSNPEMMWLPPGLALRRTVATSSDALHGLPNPGTSVGVRTVAPHLRSPRTFPDVCPTLPLDQGV